MNAETEPARPIAVRLLPFMSGVFLGFLSIGIPLAALSLYVNGTLGYGSVTVGWIVGIQSVTTLLTRKKAGDFADARGTKRSALVGMAICAVSGLFYLGSAALTATPGWALAVLAIGRLVLGLGESLMITGLHTWAMGTVGPQNTGKVFLWNGMAMYAAIAVGAPIGLWLMRDFGFAGLGVAVTVAPLIAFAIAVFVRPVMTHSGKRLPFYRVVGAMLGPGFGMALGAVGYGVIGAFIALDYAGKGWAGAGYVLTASGCAFIVARLLFSGLADRIRGARVATMFLPVEIVGQALLWSGIHPVTALLGAALTGFGFSLLFPAFGAEAMKRVPPQNRAAAVGGFTAFFDLAIAGGGPLAGLIAGEWGYPSVFIFGAAAAIVALLIAIREARIPVAQPGTA